MGLNTYMYAPKDDYKHRAFWRELYSVEEAGMYLAVLGDLKFGKYRQVWIICQKGCVRFVCLLVHAEFGIGEIWFLTCIKQTKNIYLLGDSAKLVC